MKNIVFNTLFLICSMQASAQTFFGTAPLPIPPGAPAATVGVAQSPATVSGVGVLGGCFNIQRVDINLNHTFVGDIGILLIAPNGAFLDLSTSNGGGADNYTNTVFSDAAPTFITSSAPPYTGTFRPEGRATTLTNPYSNANPLGTFTFANTFNGVNADGDWILYINDYVAIDIGVVNSWSITFGNTSTAPTANAGPDVNICAGQSINLTATGGGTYSWSTGSSTATTSVNPTTTTTYTVTVTTPGCGTDTDDVIVNVVPLAGVGITASTTSVCPGGSATLTASAGFTSYSWSTGQSGGSISTNQPGTYTVTVTNSVGCTGTASVTLTPRPLPSLSLSSAVDVCGGQCQTVTVNLVGTAPFSFQWRLEPGGSNQTVNTNNSTTSFQVCAPATAGPVQLVVCSLTDAFCTSQ